MVFYQSLPGTSGDPQGSVLGPLFFLIFIDDMIDVPEVSKVFCYADDTKLLCHGDLCLNSAQNHLCSLRLWAYCNYLSFNSAESGYLQISRSALDNILLGDVEIPSLDNITDLGIEVSKTLKWSLHIQSKIVKARGSFNYLKHSVPFNLPSGVEFNLFKACVLSVLLYGYPAWFPETFDLRKLEQLNIQGLRWCFGYNDYSSLLKLSNSVPICYQLIERDIRVFTSILNNENCISFDKFFKLDSKVLNLRTLDRERLALTRAKKRCTEKSFFFRVERILNDAADFLNVSISFFRDTCKSKTATQNLL